MKEVYHMLEEIKHEESINEHIPDAWKEETEEPTEVKHTLC